MIGQGLVHVHVVRGDEYANSKTIARQVAEPRALVEPGLRGRSPLAGFPRRRTKA